MDSAAHPSSIVTTEPEPLRVFPTIFSTDFLTRVTTEKDSTTFSFYGTFEKEFLVAEAASFIATCTDADLPLLSKTLADFLDHTSKDCVSEASRPELATQACWLTIRVWHPTDEFVVPRWHRDGRMFDCSCQGSKLASGRSLPHSKYAVTLLGPGTLLLAPFQRHVDDTLATCKWGRDEERKPLADSFAKCELVPVQTGQVIRFSWGEEDSPVHSEPDSSGSDRVFVSVLYGSKEELEDMCKFRETRYGHIEV